MPRRHTGEWRNSSTILELGTRWEWALSFTPLLIYHPGKRPRERVDRRGGGPSAGMKAVEKRKISCSPAGNRTPAIHPVAHYQTDWAIPALHDVSIQQRKSNMCGESVGEVKNAYKILLWNLECKRPLETYAPRWENNTKTDVRARADFLQLRMEPVVSSCRHKNVGFVDHRNHCKLGKQDSDAELHKEP
jgi:hypothetical protein